MPPTPRTLPVSHLALVALGALVGLCAAEIGLRATGSAPHGPSEARFRVTPSEWVAPDPDSGWSLRPGSFRFTFGDGYSWTARHDDDGHRVTPPGSGRVLELHGGSFAYGLGLDDADSMGWRLQELLPEHDVRVRAVPGHGPLQAWAAMQDHIHDDTAPYAMIVTYASFHDERVTWNRSWRRALGGTQFADSVPATRTTSGPPRVESVDPRPSTLPGAHRSAAVARVDRWLETRDERALESWRVTWNLLVELHHLAKANGTYVLVVGLTDDEPTRAMMTSLQAHGVLTLDAGLDPADRRHQLWPHDHHPNTAAADHWARSVANLVQQGQTAPPS